MEQESYKLSRRDFFKVVGTYGAGLATLFLGACAKKYKVLLPTSAPKPTPSTLISTETPGPTATTTATMTSTPTPSETPTPTPEILTPEKIAFLAAHNFYHGRTNEKIVMMTYDEGLVHNNVQHILDIYKKHNARCTFFMTGTGLRESKDLLSRIIDEGHIIGCHGWVHEEMTQFPDNDIKTQFDKWFTRLYETLPDYQVNYFRTPFGSWNTQVLEVAASYGMQHVDWTVESGGMTPGTYDYVFKNFQIYQNNYRATGGAIVLSHTHRFFDSSQADKILDKWNGLGYKLITVDEGKMDKDRWVQP